MKSYKIGTSMLMQVKELNEEKYQYTFEAMRDAIDCEMIDIVHAVNLPEPYSLIVDDEALLKEKPIVNPIASYLYGFLDHGQPICGDVIILRDKFTQNGVEAVGLEPEDIKYLSKFFCSEDVFEKVKETIIKLESLIEGRTEND